MQEQRNAILGQILMPAAKERLSRLALVRPDKARAVEDSLITADSHGKLKEKVTEEQLIQFLGQLDGGSDAPVAAKQSAIKVQRRKYMDDDDDDDDSDLL